MQNRPARISFDFTNKRIPAGEETVATKFHRLLFRKEELGLEHFENKRIPISYVKEVQFEGTGHLTQVVKIASGPEKSAKIENGLVQIEDRHHHKYASAHFIEETKTVEGRTLAIHKLQLIHGPFDAKLFSQMIGEVEKIAVERGFSAVTFCANAEDSRITTKFRTNGFENIKEMHFGSGKEGAKYVVLRKELKK
ncbi:MAG: hypothetical protein NTY48_06265 [Candidatus Diapherotrites archaeon]|nr:hypothetical protein [Candidatus Diapherotrites archaeon]